MAGDRLFAQVDVFGSAPYLGNPVAVVLEGDGPSDEQMQRVARWTNLSETTFVVAPTTSAADYRLRIFTPGGELPFAGHPTLGSAHAWLESGGHPQGKDRVVQECGAGLVTLRRGGDTVSFAAPPTLRSGPIEQDYLDKIVEALRLDPTQVLAHRWIDNGPGWAVVQLSSAADVLALEPEFAQLPQAMVGAIGAHPAGSAHQFELRTFAPGVGVFEDPVCGSMNASIGQWLTATGAVPPRYRVSQGTRVGRAGSIEINADQDGTVWVGGTSTTCIRGTIGPELSKLARSAKEPTTNSSEAV